MTQFLTLNLGRRNRKSRKSQLRVVFDTNALYVAPNSLGSASDLVRNEIVSVISESKYPDLDIFWYLPEVVRHERQYQMQTEALKLRFPINKIERLLGLKLALTDQALLNHVKTKIDEKEVELGLKEIALDHKLVDWPSIVHASLYRLPPFEAGDKEKGFRDAIVGESFLQLLADSPKTPSLCRVVLVTGDELLSRAVRERIASSPNASVLASIEELKGLINTIVSNVGEDFIALLKPKAAKIFFVSGDENTIYFKEKVGEAITGKFAAQLEKSPEGTTFRKNVKWLVEPPNFSRKEARRVFSTSRLEAEFEAGTVTRDGESKPLTYSGLGVTSLSDLAKPTFSDLAKATPYALSANRPIFMGDVATFPQNVGWNDLNSNCLGETSRHPQGKGYL